MIQLHRSSIVVILLFLVWTSTEDRGMVLAQDELVALPRTMVLRRHRNATLSFSSTLSEGDAPGGSLSLSHSGSPTELPTASVSGTVSPAPTRTNANLTSSPSISFSQTETITPPPTPTITSTPSLGIRNGACTGIDVALLEQVIFPTYSDAVTATSSIGVILSADVIQTIGYFLQINITTCHEFRNSTLFGFSWLYQGDGTTAGIQSAINPSLSSIVNPSNGFLDVVQKSASFATVDFTNDKTITVKLGPYGDYGLFDRAENVQLKLLRSSFQPDAPSDVFIPITILPLPTGSGGAEQTVAEAMAVAVSVTALIIQNPTTSMVVGRVNLLTSGLRCPDYASDRKLSFLNNPTGLGFGVEKNLYYHVGATLMNPLLFILTFFCHLTLVVLANIVGRIAGLSTARFSTAMRLLRFPAYTISYAVIVYQGTVTSAITVFMNTESPFYSFASAFVILLCILFPVVVILRLTGNRFHAIRANNENPAHRTPFPIKVLFGVGTWIDRSKKFEGFVSQFGALFQHYLASRRHFLAIDLACLSVFGALDSYSPTTRTGCMVGSILQLVVYWLYLILVIGFHPYHTLFSFGIYTAIVVTQLVASLCTLLRNVMPTSTHKDILTAATAFILISVIFALIKTIHDFVWIGYYLKFRDELHQNIARWRKDAKRKAWMERRKAVVSRTLDVALDATDQEIYFGPGAVDETAHVVSDCSEDSDNMRNADDREPQRIESVVEAVVEPTPATEAEEKMYLEHTGMTKKELWKFL